MPMKKQGFRVQVQQQLSDGAQRTSAVQIKHRRMNVVAWRELNLHHLTQRSSILSWVGLKWLQIFYLIWISHHHVAGILWFLTGLPWISGSGWWVGYVLWFHLITELQSSQTWRWVHCTQTSSRSPDLSPAEHHWDAVERRLASSMCSQQLISSCVMLHLNMKHETRNEALCKRKVYLIKCSQS